MQLLDLFRRTYFDIKKVSRQDHKIINVKDGFFKRSRKECVVSETWDGYAVLQNGLAVFEIFVSASKPAKYKTYINGSEETTIEGLTAELIFADIENLYKEKLKQKQESARLEIEKQKQNIYDMLIDKISSKGI